MDQMKEIKDSISENKKMYYYFYYKLKTQLKTAFYFLSIGLISLISSMYGVQIILGDSLVGQLLSLVLVGIFSISLILFSENMISYFKSFKIDSPFIIGIIFSKFLSFL